TGFAEPQRNNQRVALTAFFLDAPPLVVTEGRLEPSLLCIDTHFVHDCGELVEIDIAHPFQVVHFPKPPVLIFLLGQHPEIHQHIHRCGISTIAALHIHGRMHLGCELLVVHLLSPRTFDFIIIYCSFASCLRICFTPSQMVSCCVCSSWRSAS